MLTVALDVTPLLGARTGIGVVVDGFVRCLSGRDEVALTGYGLTGRAWRQLSRHLRAEGISGRSRPAPAAALLRAWSCSGWPPGEWWTGPSTVVHGTNFVVPPSRGTARIVSVWDMTAVRYPEMCTRTSRLYPGLVARAVAGGAWVHTGAHSVAEEVVDHFGIPPERIRVVPPAVGAREPVPPSAGPAVAPPPAGAARVGRTARPVERPYVLGLGRTEPRKDFPRLVRAFDRIADDLPDLELRIAGPVGWAEDAVREAIAAATHRDRIRRDGWVPDVDALIAGATVFAYPSVYEGFGLPPLEAMALGVPVVATRAGAIPEVVGDGADLVPPADTDALAEAMASLLTDSARRAELVEAGRRQVARFSGARTAEGLISAYRDAAGLP
jgi:glycosyltransferase involved in cell wall biosynthesis